jgi:hypothetical protein
MKNDLVNSEARMWKGLISWEVDMGTQMISREVLTISNYIKIAADAT